LTTATTFRSLSVSGQEKSTPSRDSAWLNVLAHLDPKYSGMSAAVRALASAVYDSGKHAVSLAGFCAADEDYSPFTNNHVTVTHLPNGHASWLKDTASQVLQNLIRESSGVHVHGLSGQSTWLAVQSARKAGKPYIASAHGMLQSWALNNRRIRKAIHGALIERSNLRHAGCLHALTHAEVKAYRDYGLQNPVAVIPNGVDIPRDIDPCAFLNEFPGLRGKRLILSLGRLHFKKGLDLLCEAWAAAARRWPDAQLVLAGSGLENTRTSVEDLVSASGIGHQVTFTGMLNSALKWSALSAADCFVLPSYSEGSRASVLEAMGVGLPVIITKECNLPEVAELGCGWVIEPNSSQLESALHECLAASTSDLAGMRANGQRLVERDYGWRVVGKHMSEVYTWMQGGPVSGNVVIHFGGRR
jgi:glycosyltransferase involved in cell wall biosynthesis